MTRATDPKAPGSTSDGRAARRAAAGHVLARQPDLRDWQEDLYRTLHQHPELAHQEVQTAAAAAGTLRDAGYDVHDGVGTTGVVGILENGDGPVVLMRADMDGLPMQEETGLPYASTDQRSDEDGRPVPVAHACGHDVHVATLMGAARLLAADRSAWRGTFIPLFQPAEERGTGARAMLDGGLTRMIPKPHVGLAQHVLPYPAGTVGTHAGPFLSTAASMRITVSGRGSHGSMPQLSVDPVVLAASIVMRLQTLVSREIAPDDFAVVTVGRLAAGTKSNIIPDDATLELNIRAFDDATKTKLLEGIRRIVQAECVASGTPQPPAFELYDEYPPTINDASATATVATAFDDYFGTKTFAAGRLSASEDFSLIPGEFAIPYTFWALGGTDAALWHEAEAAGRMARDIPANHSPKFAPAIQPTLEAGTAAIVVASLAWLAR